MMVMLERIERRVFALVNEAEYRLGLAPRGTRLQPTRLQTWILRYIELFAVVILVVFSFTSGATRTRSLLGVALLAVLAALAVLWVDARRSLARVSGARKRAP